MQKDVSSDLTRQYKTMQTEMGIRVRQLETEVTDSFLSNHFSCHLKFFWFRFLIDQFLLFFCSFCQQSWCASKTFIK